MCIYSSNIAAKSVYYRKNEETTMEGKTSAGEPPKYYNERQRDAMQRYRKKRKTIQLSLTFKVWKKALMEQQAAKRGLSMNKYFLGMMEKDAQGMVYIIPDMNRNEAIARISEIVNMASVDEKADAMMEALPGAEATAVAEPSSDTGVGGRKLIRTLLACISTEMTYIAAETIIESLEEYGADRDALFAAVRRCGFEPIIPAQCMRSDIKEPEEEKDN